MEQYKNVKELLNQIFNVDRWKTAYGTVGVCIQEGINDYNIGFDKIKVPCIELHEWSKKGYEHKGGYLEFLDFVFSNIQPRQIVYSYIYNQIIKIDCDFYSFAYKYFYEFKNYINKTNELKPINDNGEYEFTSEDYDFFDKKVIPLFKKLFEEDFCEYEDYERILCLLIPNRKPVEQLTDKEMARINLKNILEVTKPEFHEEIKETLNNICKYWKRLSDDKICQIEEMGSFCCGTHMYGDILPGEYLFEKKNKIHKLIDLMKEELVEESNEDGNDYYDLLVNDIFDYVTNITGKY